MWCTTLIALQRRISVSFRPMIHVKILPFEEKKKRYNNNLMMVQVCRRWRQERHPLVQGEFLDKSGLHELLSMFHRL